MSYESTNTLFNSVSRLRPKRNNPAVLKKAAETMVKKVSKWCDDADEPLREDEVEHLSQWFIKELVYYHDGYEIVKKMENDLGYAGDSYLVELMDDATTVCSCAYYEFVKKWVKEEGIKPTLNIGDKVVYTHKSTNVEGIITGVDLLEAQYLVFSESRGHVRSGVGSHGCYIPFEDVKKCE